jgi:RHS repeat-associated protein
MPARRRCASRFAGVVRDGNGRLFRTTDAAQATRTLTYEISPAKRWSTVTTAEGKKYSYERSGYSHSSLERTETDSAGLTRTTVSTPERITSREADGTTVTVLRSADPQWGAMASFAASASVVLPSGLTHRIARQRSVVLSMPSDPFSVTSISETVSLNDRTFTSTFSTAEMKLRTVTPLGRSVEQSVDGAGRLVQIAAGDVAPITFAYDELGRLLSMAQNDRVTRIDWDDFDRPLLVTDPVGRSARYAYDASGHISSLTYSDGRVVAFEHDESGNVTSITPPGRHTYRFRYTAVDLQDQSDEDGSVTQYLYDRDRNLQSIALSDGSKIGFEYGTDGRLVAVSAPSVRYVYSYTSSAQVAGVTHPDGALSYTWDGPLLNKTTWAGAISGTVSVTHDGDFNVSSEAVNESSRVSFSYDSDGLLAAAGALTIVRKPQNELIMSTTLGVVSDSFVHGVHGEVSSYAAIAAGSPILSFDYGHDVAGRVTRVGTRLYAYDAAGRLQKVTENGLTVAEYEYDLNGNRLRHAWVGGENAATYNDQDQLLTYGDTSYTYDGRGCLRSKTLAGDVTTYEYDVFGNLRKSVLPDRTTVEYVVDGRNRRIGKKLDGVLVEGWLYSDQLHIVAVIDGNGAVRSRFVYATRSNVPDYMIRDGVTYRILTDHVGSPRLVINVADGTVAQRIEYDEFGRVSSDTAPGFQPFGFAGGLVDRETGLVRFGARDYDPHTGRWTTKEPRICLPDESQRRLKRGRGQEGYALLNGVPSALLPCPKQ